MALCFVRRFPVTNNVSRYNSLRQITDFFDTGTSKAYAMVSEVRERKGGVSHQCEGFLFSTCVQTAIAIPLLQCLSKGTFHIVLS
jgi:hypothetical protein